MIRKSHHSLSWSQFIYLKKWKNLLYQWFSNFFLAAKFFFFPHIILCRFPGKADKQENLGIWNGSHELVAPYPGLSFALHYGLWYTREVKYDSVKFIGLTFWPEYFRVWWLRPKKWVLSIRLPLSLLIPTNKYSGGRISIFISYLGRK